MFMLPIILIAFISTLVGGSYVWLKEKVISKPRENGAGRNSLSRIVLCYLSSFIAVAIVPVFLLLSGSKLLDNVMLPTGQPDISSITLLFSFFLLAAVLGDRLIVSASEKFLAIKEENLELQKSRDEIRKMFEQIVTGTENGRAISREKTAVENAISNEIANTDDRRAFTSFIGVSQFPVDYALWTNVSGMDNEKLRESIANLKKQNLIGEVDYQERKLFFPTDRILKDK